MNVIPVCRIELTSRFSYHLFFLAIVEARTAVTERDSLRERLRVNNPRFF